MKVHELTEGTPIGGGEVGRPPVKGCYQARCTVSDWNSVPLGKLWHHMENTVSKSYLRGKGVAPTYAPTCFSHGLRTLPGDIHFTTLHLSPKQHSGFSQRKANVAVGGWAGVR